MKHYDNPLFESLTEVFTWNHLDLVPFYEVVLWDISLFLLWKLIYLSFLNLYHLSMLKIIFSLKFYPSLPDFLIYLFSIFNNLIVLSFNSPFNFVSFSGLFPNSFYFTYCFLLVFVKSSWWFSTLLYLFLK